jgi:hypothetical protein
VDVVPAEHQQIDFRQAGREEEEGRAEQGIVPLCRLSVWILCHLSRPPRCFFFQKYPAEVSSADTLK